MTKLVLAVQQHRNELVPARLQLRVLIDVDHLDRPVVLLGKGPERINQVVAEMTPRAAENREGATRGYVHAVCANHRYLPARKLT